MYDFDWLQMFAEGGAGDGGAAAGAAPTGDTAAAAGQQEKQEETVADRLRRKGVPEQLLSRRAYQQKVVMRVQAQTAEAGGQAAAVDNPDVPEPQNAAEAAEAAPETEEEPDFNELLKTHPKYNKAVQDIVKGRLAKSKAAEQRLNEFEPILQTMARRYGLGTDFTAEQLAEHVNGDDSYYEQQAMELGVSPEMARRLEQADVIIEQRDRERQEQARANEQDQKIQETFDRLYPEIERMQEKYPGFDFAQELLNNDFLRMISPSSGLSLEQAYFAIHRDEIIAAERQAAERRVAASMAANRARPAENVRTQGTSDTSMATTIDWRRATKAQRDALKKRIESGERVLPGQGFR